MSAVIVLAIVQGLTEFLPISSSAHLILTPVFLGWQDQGLAFDVAVHVGTLLAVVIYFRADLTSMLRAWLRSLGGAPASAHSRLAWAVLFGTIPAGLAGLAFADAIEEHLRSPMVIAATTAVFGVLLWVSDRLGRRQRDEHTISAIDVLAIGVAQALALIPGTSRSGITMTAGLAMGLTRKASARFSFLLSVPLIALAGAHQSLGLIQSPQPVNWPLLSAAVALSAGSAYLCIGVFLRFVERVGMLPFAIYRLVLAGVIVAVFSGRV